MTEWTPERTREWVARHGLRGVTLELWREGRYVDAVAYLVCAPLVAYTPVVPWYYGALTFLHRRRVDVFVWLGWRWMALADRIDRSWRRVRECIDRAWNRARDRVDGWFLGESIDAAIDGALVRKALSERLAASDSIDPPNAH